MGPAWLEADGAGSWRPRKGRLPEDHFDEKRATVRMAEMVREDAERVTREADEEHASRNRPPTLRQVAREWLVWLEEVRGARASTLRDYRSTLAEAGTPHRRGNGTTSGRMMAAFGDVPISDITTTDISHFLRSLDKVLASPRTVNKHRQVLSAIFNYARREDTYRLAVNPVTPTTSAASYQLRRWTSTSPTRWNNSPRRLREVHTARTRWVAAERLMELGPDEIVARVEEDAQDGELFRVLAYTGLRLGEPLALQWGDVDFTGRRLIVQRAVSGTIEGPTKGWQVRYVPLADPARDALQRLLARGDFTQREDYVFCGRLGTRLDGSALRRRYHAARKAAGLRYLKLHGLRHGAGSLVARHTDAVFVQHFLGHAKLATTERYMHAKARAEDIDKLNLAFGVAPRTETEA